MAARFGQLALRKTGQDIFNNYNFPYIFRSYGTKIKIKKRKAVNNNAKTATIDRRIGSMGEALSAKGFLRSTKSYTPPDNVNEKIKDIFAKFKLPATLGYSFKNMEEKFKVLDECFKNFQHSIPNSQICEMKTIEDIIKFYKTPVDTTVPLDAMKNVQLPENLHIQYDYVRFHPDTDTMFNGQTAFPKSSTLVTGLKYRDKYPGHIAKNSWP